MANDTNAERLNELERQVETREILGDNRVK